MRNKEVDNWLEAMAKDSGQKIANSEIFAGIITKNAIESPQVAIQLGFALMMDKPIVLLVDKKMKLSKSLVKIASLIEQVDLDDPQDMRRATAAIQKFSETLPE